MKPNLACRSLKDRIDLGTFILSYVTSGNLRGTIMLIWLSVEMTLTLLL